MERSRNASGSIELPSRHEPDAERDADLERDLILLLSKLDHYRARLSDKQVCQRPTLALQILLNMLDEVTGFTEHFLNGLNDDQIGRVELTHAGELYLSIQEVLKEFTPNALQSVFSLFRGQSNGRDQRHQTFHALTRSFLEDVKTFFELFQGFFRASGSGSEWSQAYQLFLADLESTFGLLHC
jgi:hypothetical protein